MGAPMKWTKLKQLVEARFAPEAVGRVQVHTTRYRHAHDQEGEFLVTLDGDKIYGAAYYRYLKARAAMEADAGAQDIEGKLEAQGVADHVALHRAMFESLSQSVEEMLASPRPLIRALGVLDARCGKRRLARLDDADEHDLVRRVHQLRRSSGVSAV